MGMLNRTRAPWTNMSQGERGRVLIARALMSNPSLLLLDEPATGLDLAAREQLLLAIAQLRTDVPNLATVMVTHHLEELPIVTSHALLLRDGAVRAVGPVDVALTSDTVSDCFGFDVAVARHDGRWSVRAEQSGANDSRLHGVSISAAT
jgi:iron complex transport system ATP-binding protein